METTDAFRARFEANYYQLLVKKGVDPSTARARARAKAASLPARIETPAAAPAPAPAAPPTPVAAPPAPPAPAIKREAPSSDESEDDDGDESDDDAVPLASRSVDELKAICRRRNLRVGGKKAELVQRIVDDDGGVREPLKKKRRVRKRNWGRGSMSGQQLGAMASAMRVVLPEQLPTPALVSREAPAQRQDHVCTCLSGHPDRCSAPVHICACCTGNFAACRATAHNCNCTTMISLLSSTAIPCQLCGKIQLPGRGRVDGVGRPRFVSTQVPSARPPVSVRQPVAQVPVARPQVHLRNGAREVSEAS